MLMSKGFNMIRRMALLLVAISLMSSTSFALSNGCNAYLCANAIGTEGDEVCVQPISEWGGGNLASCTTVRQCNAAHECIRYCRWSSCYWV
jgi:hypothetical protein